MAQRTLSRTIPALLPTPQASDGDRGPDYARQRERTETHGSGGDDLTTTVAKIEGGGKLLPTPTAGDAKASGSRNLEGSSAHPGVSLTDAVRTGDSTTPRRLPTPTAEDGERGRNGSGSDRLGAATFDDPVRLLPTPQAADGDGGRQETGAMSAGGVRPSGQKATLPLPTAVSMREDISDRPFAAAAEPGEQEALFDSTLTEVPASSALLPTPVANPDNPGAGGELRAAIIHGEGRRNETGVDTLGRPNHGRGEPLLPTPTTQDASNNAGPSQRERNSDPLNVAAAKLLPTPQAADGERSSEQMPRHYAGKGDNPTLLGAARRSDVSWGVYEPAVRRWETIFGREAPPPTDEKGRLDPPFVEWMLGYPPGWFDLPGLKRTAKLRALGNSVQVQCAEEVGYWIRDLLESGLLLPDDDETLRP